VKHACIHPDHAIADMDSTDSSTLIQKFAKNKKKETEKNLLYNRVQSNLKGRRGG
jgi:hypothetical protein